MMRLARLKRPVAVTAALILATAGFAVRGRQRPAPGRAGEKVRTAAPAKAGAGGPAVPDMAANRALAREQLALIDQALTMLDRLKLSARIQFSDPRFSLWARRKLEALRKSGAGKAEIAAALESYIDRLKLEEASTENEHQFGRATQVEVHDVRFRRLEAEIWLNEEKAR